MSSLETINGYSLLVSTGWVKQDGLLPSRVIMVKRADNDFVVSTQTADEMPDTNNPNWQPHDEWLQEYCFTDFKAAAEKFAEMWREHADESRIL